MNALDYLSQLFQLKPSGAAMTDDPASVTGKTLHAIADSAARADTRAVQLLTEMDPRTAEETLADWERDLGLPDTCTGAITDPTERRAAVWQKLTATGGQSRAYFIEVCARLGFEATITEYRPAYCTSLCTTRVFTTAWRFAWKVTVANAASAPVLECILNRLKPAHTVVFFTYEG